MALKRYWIATVQVLIPCEVGISGECCGPLRSAEGQAFS